MKQKLTAAEEAQIPIWRDRWFDIGSCTEPADRPRAERAITGMYKEAGETEPRFVWCRGPAEAVTVLSWTRKSVTGECFPGQVYAYWICLYKYCEDVLKHKYAAKDSRRLNLWSELVQSADVWFPYRGLCVACDRPKTVKFNDRPIEQRALHCEDGPALEYRDGWKVFSWNGTTIPGDWIVNKDKVDAKLALTWENIEQRRALCEILGWKRVLEQLKCKVIDKDPDPEVGTLLEAPLPTGKARFLRAHCPTGRDFVLSVPMEMKSARQANAWSYGLDVDAHRKLEFRT